MTKLLLILFASFLSFAATAQSDTDTAKQTTDTQALARQPAVRKAIKKRITGDTASRAARRQNAPTDSVAQKDSALLVNDTAKASDTVATRILDTTKRIDTTKLVTAPKVVKKPIDSIYLRLLNNPYLSKAKPIYVIRHEREIPYKDEVFYLFCGLLLFLAFIKLVFSRYFKNIFRLLLQPSFRQKQTREQLLQNNLPSLLLNLFFIISAGTYVAFLLKYSHLTNTNLWSLLLYTNAALLALYLGKYLFLRFAGWVFNVKEATEAYLFSVYLVNKILGVILLPFTLTIAFSQPTIINISITISVLIIFLLYFYRYLVSFAPVRKEIKVSVLHFFFYIFAFEIMPLLLIYKTLIIFLDNSH